MTYLEAILQLRRGTRLEIYALLSGEYTLKLWDGECVAFYCDGDSLYGAMETAEKCAREYVAKIAVEEV